MRDRIFIDRVYLGNNIFLTITFAEMSLGVKLDSGLMFTSQIDMILKQSYRYILDLGRIRKFFNSK